MTAVWALPHTSDAFSEYRPTKNAHLDFLYTNGSNKIAGGTVDGVRSIKLAFKSMSTHQYLTGQADFQMLKGRLRHPNKDYRL